MKEEVQRSLCKARCFYFISHLIAFASLFIYQSELSEDYNSGNYYKIGYLITLQIIVYYFFLQTGKNPGFAPQVSKESHSDRGSERFVIKNKEIQHIPNISEQDEEKTLNLLNNYKNQSCNDDFVNEIEMMQIERRNSEVLSPVNFDSGSDKSDNFEKAFHTLPYRHYCPVCNIRQFYRTRHCDLCDRCVYKYDHHCFWIGSCVGELNHRMFFGLVFFELLILLEFIQMSLAARYNYIFINPNSADSIYGYQYGIFWIIVALSSLFALFCFLLIIYHSFLILSNQSTWEHNRRNCITYMRIYPKGFYPFSQGILGNIKKTFFHNNKPTNWELPTVEYAHEYIKNNFNICENRYYNLCQSDCSCFIIYKKKLYSSRLLQRIVYKYKNFSVLFSFNYYEFIQINKNTPQKIKKQEL